LRGALKKAVADRVSLSAGSLAYHWFLAFFPAVIAVIAVIGMAHPSNGAIAHLTHAINVALPNSVAQVFNGAVTDATKRTSASAIVLVTGIVIALWSASSGMAALQQALDVAYEAPRDRKFLARRARAFPLMTVTLAFGGIAAVLIVFGAPIGAAIDGHVPLHGLAFHVLWTIVRWAITLVCLTMLFSIYFAVGPNRKDPSWRWNSPGGVLSTIVFVIASVGFSYYASHFGSYGKTYGSLAGAAIFIFWLYLSGLAILFGAELNAELERQIAPAPSADIDRT
jgi:membrane protein